MPQRFRAAWVGVALSLALTVPSNASAGEEQSGCLKKMKAMGYPHRLKIIAELNAVRSWVQQAGKKGEGYEMWHNARLTGLSCDKNPRSDYYRCMATGQPCLPRHAAAEKG